MNTFLALAAIYTFVCGCVFVYRQVSDVLWRVRRHFGK